MQGREFNEVPVASASPLLRPRKHHLRLAISGTRGNSFESPLGVPNLVLMKPAWIVFLAVTLALACLARGATGDTRFSQSLNGADKTANGLTKLNSDQLAVIDALVRRDTTSRGSSTPATDETKARFSQRLTADERRVAGLPLLTEAEVARLDAAVDRFQAAKLARTLLAPPTYLSRHAGLKPEKANEEKKLHGSFSLSYGWGKGGYSEKTGAMTVTLDDPQRGYSVSIGYAETHTKGGSMYRDPFYDDLRDPLLDARRDPFYYDRRDPFYPNRMVPELRDTPTP